MNETYLTAVGRLITTPDRWRFTDGSCKVTFRVASNQRRFDRTTNGWTDGDTLYLTVVCRRDLAANVHASFQVGDPIIVHGRLITREWEKDGKRRSIVELDASAVGPNLSACTATVIRARRAAAGSGDGAETAYPDPVGTDTVSVGEGLVGGSGRNGGAESAVEVAGTAHGSTADPFGAGVGGAEMSDDGYPDDWPDDDTTVVTGVPVEAAVGS